MSEFYPWLAPQWEALMARVRAERLPHALLFAGPDGVGRQAFALRLAQALLCMSPQSDGQPCGGCKGCELFEAGSHPDLLRISPEEDSKQIRIAQVRALIEHLGLTSQLGGFRVAVIDPADCMNANAANSLLKTLEEPGPRTLLILESARPGELPATIRSRCQQVLFPPPPRSVTAAWLRQQPELQDQDPDLLLALAGGAPLEAHALADPERLDRRRQFLQAVAGLARGDGDPAAVAAQWHNREPDQCIAWLRRWIADLIRCKSAGQVARLENPDLAPELHRLAQQVDLRGLFGHLDRLRHARRWLQGSVNEQTILEHVLLPLRKLAGGR